MTPEQFQRIDKLFAQAGALPPESQSDFLQRECPDDAEVRAEVESLLQHDRKPHLLLETPVTELRMVVGELSEHGQSAPVPHLPERIGQYEIIDVLGTGGMGVVYRAKQSNPRRTVALKVLRPELVTERMLRRFDLEAQVLGRLRHPGIARIYEAATATTDGGTQPYFAMEYIEGEPITHHTRHRRLGTRQRLELMLEICSAVSHAHQRSVIHRDLKPGNILVDQSGHPFILDFGVARVLDTEVQATTMRTDVGQLIGTLPYMSPEQIEGDPATIDTRVDVYALGVLLFELLSDRLPHDVREKTIPEAARMICDEDPTRLSAVDRVFRGDLETIVGKALAKEPDRRYHSVEELAGDIQRYLHDQPIFARPATTMYQLKKFAKRHRAVVGGLVAVLIVLLAGVIVSGTFAIRENKAKGDALLAADRADKARAESEVAREAATEQRRIAEREALVARTVSTYLQDTFGAPNPWVTERTDAVRRNVLVVDVLDDAAAGLTESFADQPEVEAVLRIVLGRTYTSLGRFNDADVQLARAHELYTTVLEPDPETQYELMVELAKQDLVQGRFDEAEFRALEVIERAESLHGPEDGESFDARHRLAQIYRFQGRYDESIRELLDLLAHNERAGDPKNRHHNYQVTLATVYARLDRAEEAERTYRAAIKGLTDLLGEDHPSVLLTRDSLVDLLLKFQRLEEAEAILNDNYAALLRVLGDEHPETLRTMNHLADLQRQRGQQFESVELMERVLATSRLVLGEDHPDTLNTMNNMASMYRDRGRYDEALALFKDAWQGSQIMLGEEHPKTLISLSNYALTLMNLGRLEESEPLMVLALTAYRSAMGERHQNTLGLIDNLAVVYARLQRYEESEPMFRDALRLKREVLGPDHAETLVSLNNLAYVTSALGRHEEALVLNQEALAIRQRVLGESHPETLFSMHNIANVQMELGQNEAAADMFLQTLDYRSRTLGADHPDTMSTRLSLAAALNRSGAVTDALRHTADALTIGRTSLPPDHWQMGDILVRHGSYLVKAQRFEEAEPILLEAQRVLDPTLGADHPLTQLAVQSRLDLYEATGRETEAEALRAERGIEAPTDSGGE